MGHTCPISAASSRKLKKQIVYNNVEAVRTAMEAHEDKIASFLFEREARIVVPNENYLAQTRRLCDKQRVLLICDEIQTGIVSTGKLLCHQ
jgi:ornithine--oxo-acid transaminase